MKKIVSRDGTPIALDRVGEGPPVVIVVGAFNDRGTGASLAEVLKPDFTVYTYDRRGRGDSGDTKPYAIARELEDLEAIIAEAGGSACVFGYSSGGVLALDGAARALPMTKLAVYEVPLKADGPLWAVDHAAELARLVEAGRRGDAVEYFQAKVIGIPEAVVAQLRGAPFRPALEAMADTLVYEALIVGDGSLPVDLLRSVTVPTLAIAGLASVPFMRETADAIARAVPNGRSLGLEGQTHDIDPPVLGPLLAEFFKGD
jgi:pimeloyl-ACP methyl ester carboxylesterase